MNFVYTEAFWHVFTRVTTRWFSLLLCDCSSRYKFTISLSLRFNGHFSRWTWVSQYQNISILDLIRAKDDGDGGNKLSYKTAKLQSNQQTKPSFYRPGCPSCRPTNSVKAPSPRGI